MTKFVVIAKINALDGYEIDVATQIDGLAILTRAENGCIRYEIYRDPQNNGSTLIYEVWTDFAAWRAHVGTAHLQDFKKNVLEKKATMLVEKLRFDTDH